MLSAFQQCEYSHACKFLAMGVEEYMIFSKEHIFYLLKSLLNLIQPGIDQNLPFASRCTICWVKVPENKGSRLTLSKIPLLSNSNIEDTLTKCGGGRIKLMERREFGGKEQMKTRLDIVQTCLDMALSNLIQEQPCFEQELDSMPSKNLFQPKPCCNSNNSGSGGCQKGDLSLHQNSNRMTEQRLHQRVPERKI